MSTPRPTPAVAAAPAASPGVGVAPSTSAPAATVRVAGDQRVARLAATGLSGWVLAFAALLFGTAGVLLLVSARLRGARAGEHD